MEDLERASTGVPAVDAKYEPIEVGFGEDRRRYVGVQITRLERATVESFGHVDFGVRRDAAAVALATNQRVDGNWVVVVDVILQWKPRQDESGLRTVSMLDVEEKLMLLAGARGIRLITFDSFQSEGTIQRLHLHGVQTALASASRDNQLRYYTLFNQLLRQGFVRLPRDGAWALEARTELSGLVLLENSKIVHPFAGKDIADAVVGAVWNAYQCQVKSGMINHLTPKMVKVRANTDHFEKPVSHPTGTLGRQLNSRAALASQL